MKTHAFALATLVAILGSTLACGGGEPPVKEPEVTVPEAGMPEPTAPDAEAPSAAIPAAPAEPAPPATPATPTAPTMKETLGAVAKIEVMAGGKKKTELAKAADVEAVLEAIGTDQTPSGVLRKCPDDWTLVMKDAAGVEKGSVGLCRAETLGPEFWAPKGERKGITLADEAGLKKVLKLEDPAKAKPTAKSAAPKK